MKQTSTIVSAITSNIMCFPSKFGRCTVLLLMILSMVGAYAFMYALAPLQSMLEQTHGWNSVTYGRYCSAESFLNVFLLVLLFGGIAIDKIGVQISGLISTFLMLIGAGINYYALSDFFQNSVLNDVLATGFNLPSAWWNITPFCYGMPASAKLSAIGYMIFGVGIELTGVATSRITVEWFRNSNLSQAMGIQLACSRCAVAAAIWGSPRIASMFGEISPARPLLIGVLLIAIGTLAFMTYTLTSTSNNSTLKNKNGNFSIHDAKTLFTSRKYITLAIICVLYYASVYPFQRYAIQMLQYKIGISATDASDILFVLPLASAFLLPGMCRIVDKYNLHLPILRYGAILIVMALIIFTFLLPLYPYMLIAYLGIGLLGLSIAMVTASLWPAVAKAMHPKAIATGYAVIYWFQNIALMLIPIAAGYALNSSFNSNILPIRFNYLPAMCVFLIPAILCIGAIFTLKKE